MSQTDDKAIVLRDNDGDAWLRIGADQWCLMSDAMKGAKYATRYAQTRAEMVADGYGPLEVEWTWVDKQSGGE